MDWVIEKDCFCEVVDTICVRPQMYGKPIFCVHKSIGANFKWVLESAVNKTAANNESFSSAFLGVYLLLSILLIGQVKQEK
jgi:hypothetical protein